MFCGVDTVPSVFWRKGATWANLSMINIPWPWQREVGFMIHNPPFFRKSSANMMYSLGRKYVRGRKSHSASISFFSFCSYLRCFLIFFIIISFLQSWLDLTIPAPITENDCSAAYLSVLPQRHHSPVLSTTTADAIQVCLSVSTVGSAKLLERSCEKTSWRLSLNFYYLIFTNDWCSISGEPSFAFTQTFPNFKYTISELNFL
jgi:hypothetical protein